LPGIQKFLFGDKEKKKGKKGKKGKKESE